MINIVDGFQRKSIELMNKMNEIIKIRSTLDLRKVVFSNRVYILFVAYISLNKHLKKNTTKILHRHHIGVRLMIKQCTGIYVCPVALTTKLSLISTNCCPVVHLVSSSGRRYGRQLREGCSVLSRHCPVVPSVFRQTRYNPNSFSKI